jgi:hypothetical protein
MTGDVEACLWTLVNVGSLVIAVGKLPAVSKAIVKVGSGITKFLEASATAKRTLDRLEEIVSRVRKACGTALRARLSVTTAASAAGLPCTKPPGDKVPTRKPATVGTSTTSQYQVTYFKAHPELKNKVWVHHAVEQGVLKRYPGLFSKSELHSLENLRGIPNDVNAEVHLSKIRTLWNQFYRAHPTASRQQVLDYATYVDDLLGDYFAHRIR